MEDCPIGKVKEPFRRKWNEGGRGYKLELHNNKFGRFLPCSIVCIEEKDHFLMPKYGPAIGMATKKQSSNSEVTIPSSHGGKDDYLTSVASPPAKGDLKFKEWKTENNMVISWLINSMNNDIGENFLLYETAKEIWDAAIGCTWTMKYSGAI
ncbi:hypothetical protein CK203_049183 [Vitis vinifera]|uniref:Retrotransposon Copia-like N-terminal domain-containing protein n=1 Tax=Vitis vinifera TaxID=29760 RepID=A0A438GV44_VITVI|nr:hypothetical protein CK203_049183 [Vitis vinifera]